MAETVAGEVGVSRLESLKLEKKFVLKQTRKKAPKGSHLKSYGAAHKVRAWVMECANGPHVWLESKTHARVDSAGIYFQG